MNCIIFETEEELMRLTGLSHKELWDNGFDLDDWDYGLCCENRLTYTYDGRFYCFRDALSSGMLATEHGGKNMSMFVGNTLIKVDDIKSKYFDSMCKDEYEDEIRKNIKEKIWIIYCDLDDIIDSINQLEIHEALDKVKILQQKIDY